MITMMEHIFGNYCVDDDFKVTLKTFRFLQDIIYVAVVVVIVILIFRRNLHV